MRGQFAECFGNIQQGEILEEIHQQMPLGVPGNQQDKRGVCPVHQPLNVDAVIRTQGFFSQNDDWIAHGISLVVRMGTPHSFGRGNR